MEMIATSDCTALTAIRSAARIAALNGRSSAAAGSGLGGAERPAQGDEHDDRHGERADEPHRLAGEDLGFDPGELPEAAQERVMVSRVSRGR